MTTKEFTRRLDFFYQLNDAALFFSSHKLPFIYRAVIGCLNRKEVSYCVNVTLSCFGESILRDCDFLYYDRYLYSQFEIDLTYFKAFLNRLSGYQFEVLVKSHKCDNLLAYVRSE